MNRSYADRQRPETDGEMHADAEIIPELSKFKSGQTLWRIKSLREHSEVTYNSKEK